MDRRDESFEGAGRIIGIATGVVIGGLLVAWVIVGDILSESTSEPRHGDDATEVEPRSPADPVRRDTTTRTSREKSSPDAAPTAWQPEGALPETTSVSRVAPAPAIAVGTHAIAVRSEEGEWRRVLELEAGRLPPEVGATGPIDALTVELQSARAEFGSSGSDGGETTGGDVDSSYEDRTDQPSLALLVERTTPLSLLRRIFRTATAASIGRLELAARPVGSDDHRTRRNDAPTIPSAVSGLRAVTWSVGAPPGSGDGKAKGAGLAVEMRPEGFNVGTTEALLAVRQGCPWDGPTVCLTAAAHSPDALFSQARAAALRGAYPRSERLLERGIDTYDFPSLYRTVEGVKRRYPDAARVRLGGGGDTPVELLLRVSDALRSKLELSGETSNGVFWSEASKESNASPLFPRPVLAPRDR